MTAVNTENRKNLTVRDIVTVTLLTLCNMVLYFAASVICVIPMLMALFPVVISLLQGTVFMMIGIRVPRRGAYLLYSAILGISSFYIPYIVAYLLAGVFVEFVLVRSGHRHFRALTFGYVITQVLACLTSTIYPYRIALEETIKRLEGSSNSVELIKRTSEFLSTGVSVLIVVLTMVAALIGAWIGRTVMKKHVMKEDTATF